MEVQAREVSEILKVIANPNRLMILCLLEKKEYTVSELHEKLNSISMAALSQHLSNLKLAGLVENEKLGLNVYYKIHDTRILEVIKVLKEMYCDIE